MLLSWLLVRFPSADGLSFSSTGTSPPCRSSYRSQPEYVAMKPSIVVSGGPSAVSEISGGPSAERTEQTTCKPVREISVSHSSFITSTYLMFEVVEAT